MKRTMALIFMALVMVLSLNACCSHGLLPEKVVYTPGIEKRFEDLAIPVAVIVSDEGLIGAYDKDGKLLEFCVVPNKDQEPVKGLKPCPGLVGEKKILFKKNLKVTGSRGSPFCLTIEDIHGRTQTYCTE